MKFVCCILNIWYKYLLYFLKDIKKWYCLKKYMNLNLDYYEVSIMIFSSKIFE